MSKNNLRGITLGIRPTWRFRSPTSPSLGITELFFITDQVVFSAQIKERAENYRVTTTVPSSGFSLQFLFTARQTKNSSSDKIYFTYPWDGCSTIRYYILGPVNIQYQGQEPILLSLAWQNQFIGVTGSHRR